MTNFERPPQQEPELVQEFVIAGHGNLARVQEMLAMDPQLIHAAWDWGGGDWETALGGAAHVGNREIAEYLLAHGARFDLFAAAMLGQLDLVRSVLEAFPALRAARGAHGISLMAHAQRGGDEAAAVVTYLESLETEVN